MENSHLLRLRTLEVLPFIGRECRPKPAVMLPIRAYLAIRSPVRASRDGKHRPKKPTLPRRRDSFGDIIARFVLEGSLGSAIAMLRLSRIFFLFPSEFPGQLTSLLHPSWVMSNVENERRGPKTPSRLGTRAHQAMKKRASRSRSTE